MCNESMMRIKSLKKLKTVNCLRFLLIAYSLMEAVSFHPGHFQNALYFALYPYPVRWVLLFSPTKSVLLALLIDSIIAQKKIIYLIAPLLMFNQIRLGATLYRLQQCHNIYCQYPDLLPWVFLIFILIFPYNRCRKFLINILIIGIFWGMGLYHLIIIIATFTILLERDIKDSDY